jgi:hypothetical protein
MMLSGKHMIAIWGLSLLCAVPAYAQGQQDATKILQGMPPETLAKVQSLAQMLQQNIKEGKLTDDEVKRGMMSGQLGEKLKQMNPEAGQLLHDISEASKEGKGPGEESLMPLIGGLGISPE